MYNIELTRKISILIKVLKLVEGQIEEQRLYRKGGKGWTHFPKKYFMHNQTEPQSSKYGTCDNLTVNAIYWEEEKSQDRYYQQSQICHVTDNDTSKASANLIIIRFKCRS